jgi:hypothetical protein
VSVVLSGVALTAAPTSTTEKAVAAVTEDEQWRGQMRFEEGWHAIQIDDDKGGRCGSIRCFKDYSYLASTNDQGEVLCKSVDDALCGGKSYTYSAVLGPCNDKVQIDCISRIVAKSSDGSEFEGKFEEIFAPDYPTSFTGSVSQGVPDGQSPNIWTIPGARHGYGEKYAVTVSIGGTKNSTDAVAKSSDFLATLAPVSVEDTKCKSTCYDYLMPDTNPGTGKVGLWWRGEGQNLDPSDPSSGYVCFARGSGGRCAQTHAFPQNMTYRVEVKLRSEPTGWLYGRVANPLIDFETVGNATKVTVEASPIRVPVIATGAFWKDLPTASQEYFEKICKDGCHYNWREQTATDGKIPTKRYMWWTPAANSDDAFEQFKFWKDVAKDSSTALMSKWVVRSLTGLDLEMAPLCIREGKGVTGVVATNSTIYSPGPPAFDTATKQFSYKVASMHYEKDGKTEFKGTYDLIVREDVAECLYKFSNTFAAPSGKEFVEELPWTSEPAYNIYPDSEDETVENKDGSTRQVEEADVEEFDFAAWTRQLAAEIVDAPDAEPEQFEEEVVATIDAAVLTELQKAAASRTSIDLSDGWFKFSATDFTFSQPTVKVKFDATPSRKLTCISGQQIRVIRSISPKCPSGFTAATTRYCAKGKDVQPVTAVSPTCPKGTKLAQVLRCAKGQKVATVVAVAPKCPSGLSKVQTFFCVKKNVARQVSATTVKCANGFALAKQLICVKGKAVTTVTAVKPACSKGYRAKK